jgi:hypothetical protein
VAGNRIVGARRFGVYLGAVPDLTIANNTVVVRHSATAVLGVRSPARRYREHGNRWHGGPAKAFVWNGSPRTFSGYKRLSGQGRGDLVAASAHRP